MSSKSDVFGYFVPSVQLSMIFSDYLSLDDISRLDIAICNEIRRPQFLEIIGSVSCIWLESTVFNSYSISWLNKRSIKIRQLKISFYKKNNQVDTWVTHITTYIGQSGNYLQWLSIEDENITDMSMVKILKGCPNLHSVELSLCKKITDASIVQLAIGFPNLQSLRLSGLLNVTDASIIMIGKRCPYLRKIDLSYYTSDDHSITDESLINIAVCCPCLQSVTLFSCNKITDKSIIKIGEKCRGLQILNLNNCKYVKSVGISRIAEECPDLQELRLEFCNISDESIMKVAEKCSQLRILSLNRNMHTTDVSIAKIAASCPDLQELDLSNCYKISDMSIVRIARGCPNIQKLKLPYCNITDLSISIIAENCPKLLHLDLSECNQITDAGVIRLAEGCYDLRYFNCNKIDRIRIWNLMKKSCPNLLRPYISNNSVRKSSLKSDFLNPLSR